MSQAKRPIYIGRYQILQPLGEGGMGVVYLAHDPQFGREVVIKLLHNSVQDNAIMQERFEQEMRLIARLEHHAIVPVYDAGVHEGRPYLVMRRMTHGTLRDKLNQHGGRLSLPESVPIMERIAAALHVVHQNGLIHRDIKPDNILFDSAGLAYLTDFGIAKVSSRTNLTQTGTTIGTPGYMSPEQVQGQHNLDLRVDVYALTVLLFEMVTGRLPYEHHSPHILANMHLQEPIPRPSQLNPQLPRALDKLVAEGMAKKPAQRLSSAPVLANRLTQIAELPVARTQYTPNRPRSQPVPVPASSPRTAHSNSYAMWVGVGGVMLLVVLAMAFLSGGNPPRVTVTPPIGIGINGTVSGETPIPPTEPTVVDPLTGEAQPTSTIGVIVEPEANPEPETGKTPSSNSGGLLVVPPAVATTPAPAPIGRQIALTTLLCENVGSFIPDVSIEFKWRIAPNTVLAQGEYLELRVGARGAAVLPSAGVVSGIPPAEGFERRPSVRQLVNGADGEYEWQIAHIAADRIQQLALSPRGCFNVQATQQIATPTPIPPLPTPTP